MARLNERELADAERAAAPTRWSDIQAASVRLTGIVHRTPVINSNSVDRVSHHKLFFKCENFQRTGSFKLRGALNAILCLEQAASDRGVLTASSGNFAQGVAWAARHRHIAAHVVMPSDAARVKRDAVEDLGAIVYECEPTLTQRDRVLETVGLRTGAVFISAHDHRDVIAGQGTLACEFLEQVPTLDAIIAPIGGGGLISGIAIAAKTLRPAIRVIGAEPSGADDAARSKQAGYLVSEPNPQTIAKGLLIGLGKITWPVVRDYVDEVRVVDDLATVEAMRLVWERMKIVIEPSAAVAVAVAISREFREIPLERVGVVLSGGNVDLDDLPWLQVVSEQRSAANGRSSE